MSVGAILVDLHGGLIGLDDHGNIVLNTLNKMPAATTPGGIVGSGVGSVVAISNAKGGSANICLVTFQVQDVNGKAIAAVVPISVYLSDAATGIGLTATSASGAVVAGTSGTVTGIETASKAFRGITDATGKFILSITDSAKTTFYPVAVYGGKVTVGAQLTTASYD